MTNLSIVVPTLNPRITLLCLTLASILDSVRDDQKVEVLVIDNGSKQPVKSSLPSFFLERGLRFLRYEENLGYDSNLIRALNSVTSSYVWFVGDDDILSDNAVQIVLAAIEARPENLYQFRPIFFDDNPDWSSYPETHDVHGEIWLGAALSSVIFEASELRSSFLDLDPESRGSNWSHFLCAHMIEKRHSQKRVVLEDRAVAVRVNQTTSWESHFGNQYLSGVTLIQCFSELSKQEKVFSGSFVSCMRSRIETNVSDVLTLTSRVSARDLSKEWKKLRTLCYAASIPFPAINGIVMHTPLHVRTLAAFVIKILGTIRRASIFRKAS